MNTHKIFDTLNQPLVIGSKTIKKRIVLAPMTYLGHVAFRELVSGYGGFGLLFSEMYSAKRVPQENRYVSPCFRWRDEECDHLVCQIFGSDPEIMADAASRIEAEGFFGVDINFGCAMSAICRQNSGAAMLKNPEHASQIVAAVRKAVSIPVLVKFRTGWQDDPQIPVDLAKRFEDAGADALTFHPRVAPDRRTRPPKWEYISRVKSAVSVPVFGNGNVFDADDCEKMLKETGCDGISIARLALAKPWIFAVWTKGFQPDSNIYKDAAKNLSDLLVQHYDPIQAVKRFKKFAMYFSANFRFGHTFYKKILNAKDMNDINSVISDFFSVYPELNVRLNLNFF